MYIKERNWKIKYINLLRFEWSSVSERISFVHHGAHVSAAVGPGELCVVGYIPGLIRGLISKITLCFSVNDMEVTGALQERTHTVDRNTNRSSDPIRLPGPPDPRDFLRVSWEAMHGWYRTDLCDRVTPADPKILHAHKSRKWFPEPLFGSCQCGEIPFPIKYFALIFFFLSIWMHFKWKPLVIYKSIAGSVSFVSMHF